MPQFRDHARRQQGMAAQVEEEVVPHRHRCRREELLPHRRDLHLQSGTGQYEVTPLLDRARAWGRQILPIHFPAGEHGQLGERLQQRRNHVGRQLRAQRGADGVLIERSGRLRHQVGDELLDTWHIFVQSHRRGLDAGALPQHRFNLRQLHPEAANLHLGVNAAQELQLAAVGSPAGEIAGAVETLRRSLVAGDGDELLLRQLRPSQVAARQPDPAEAQLPGHARRDRPELLVENARQVVRHRLAYGDGFLRMALGAGGDYGGFGRPVGVEDAASRPPPALHQVGRAGLAAQNQQAHGGDVFVHHGKQRGDTREHRHARIGKHS